MKKASIILTIIGGVLMHFIALPFVLSVFSPKNSASIGIIGGADGPTAIFVTSGLFDSLLGWIGILGFITLNVGIVLLIINSCKKTNN